MNEWMFPLDLLRMFKHITINALITFNDRQFQWVCCSFVHSCAIPCWHTLPPYPSSSVKLHGRFLQMLLTESYTTLYNFIITFFYCPTWEYLCYMSTEVFVLTVYLKTGWLVKNKNKKCRYCGIKAHLIKTMWHTSGAVWTSGAHSVLASHYVTHFNSTILRRSGW